MKCSNDVLCRLIPNEYVCFCRYFISLSQVRYEHPYQKRRGRQKPPSSFFAVGVPTDSNEVRVWPKLPCAAGGRCSRAAWCAAVGVQRSPAGGKAHTGHRNRTPAPEKNGNRDTITVLFSYIRLRRVILAAPVIFASQVILPYGQFGRRI